jgi:copper chaperone CopZ
MKQTFQISGMTCSGCASTVERVLSGIQGIQSVEVNLEKATAQVETAQPIGVHVIRESLKSYPAYQASMPGAVSIIPTFWNDTHTWKRASLNTLNCLIGCSIGDFAMIIYLQAYHPSVSMSVQMVLAVIAGLITSISLETVLLRVRESFAWRAAFQTAISMSFLSMIAMEVVMNLTDFMLTGGKAAFGNPMYWTALGVAMVAGFLAPLPYNYYKLKKYNKACH